MIRAALAALLAHWRRNPLQFLTLFGGLALATALWTGVQAINAEARASYAAAAATLGEGRLSQLVAADGGDLPAETFLSLRRAGWLVSPVVEGRLNGVRLVGIDPLTAPAGMVALAPADAAALAALLTPPGQIRGTAATLGALGDPGPALVVAPDMAPGVAITDLATAQRLLGKEGRHSRLVLAPVQPLRRPPLDSVAPGLMLRSPGQGTDLARLTDSFHLNLTAFGLLAFAVGIFIVHGAVGLAFVQRRATVRTLRALGLPLRVLVTALAGELLLLALPAAITGVALGYAIAASLLPDVALSLRGLYGAEVAGQLAIRPGWILSGLGMALAGTALAGATGLLQMARMPLVAATAPQALAARARPVRMAALSVALLVAAGGLALWGNGLAAGFALLGCLMIGAALALPPLLSAALLLATQLARRPLAQWVWADARQQLPALSLALMALLLAMAANVGVATMVSSFRLTFVAFLDQRLSSELYVQAADAEQAARVEEVATANGAAVLPLFSVDRDLAGEPAELYGARAHATYPDNWRLLAAGPDPWGQVWAGQGVLVNEQLARRAGLAPGDVLDVGVPLTVAGIYGDYGNPVGQAVIGEGLFRDLFPEATPLRFGLRLDPAAVPAMRQAMVDAGLPSAAMTDQAAIKAFSLGVFDRTFAVTAALNVLTLAVAAFALLMSLLTLAVMRLPALAPVWAMGTTRRRLAGIEILRALALAALTALLALPLGLLLAWALLAVVNVAAFGWRLPMFLFPLDYLRLTLAALAAAGLAAAFPALRLWRTPPADLLKVFAGER